MAPSIRLVVGLSIFVLFLVFIKQRSEVANGPAAAASQPADDRRPPLAKSLSTWDPDVVTGDKGYHAPSVSRGGAVEAAAAAAAAKHVTAVDQGVEAKTQEDQLPDVENRSYKLPIATRPSPDPARAVPWVDTVPVPLVDISKRQPKPPKAKDAPPALLIVKFARSGSTWMGTMYQDAVSAEGKPFFFMYEVQNCAKQALSSQDRSTTMQQYLKELYSGVYEKILWPEDNCHMGKARCCKPLNRMDRSGLGLIGTSISPADNETKSYLDWDDDTWRGILNPPGLPPVKVAFMLRTNVVKRGLSRIAARKMVEVCGMPKIIPGRASPECMALNSSLWVDTRDLRGQTWASAAMQRQAGVFADRLARLVGQDSAYRFSYEDLQVDSIGVMQSLSEWAGVQMRTPRNSDFDTGSVKRGSDDLSTYISNFDKVEPLFRPFPCLHQMLTSVRPQNFEECTYTIPDSWRPKCYARMFCGNRLPPALDSWNEEGGNKGDLRVVKASKDVRNWQRDHGK